jgi:hypothetical protein
MRRAAYSVFVSFTLLAAVALVPFRAAAASPPPTKILTLTPATEKPTIQPGTAASGSFQIINQGQQTYPVKIYGAPYSVQGEGYTPDFTPLPGKPKVADWLKFTASTATIKPGQTLSVGYTIAIPAGTQPGGYYAVAFVETEAGKSNQGVVINERVGEIFYITVAGPVKKAGKLLDWSSPFLQQPPFSAKLRLENDGGVHYASNIHVTVSDIFGHAKYSLSTQKEVLPQTIRQVPVPWDKAPALGLFKVSGTATIVGKTQTLSTKYVLIMSRTVRMVFAGLVVVLLAFMLGRSVTRRKLGRKQTHKLVP